MKRIFLLFIIGWVVSSFRAQTTYTVTPEVANLGEVLYCMPREFKFTITNTSDNPLIITQVHPSCGCISVTWTKEPIAKGASGEVLAMYDARMLGVFQKDIEVYTNASDEPFYLHFQGRVVSETTDYLGTFPIDLGVVRMSNNVIEFDDVNKGDEPRAEIEIVNMGRKSYKPMLMHLPDYISAQYHPEVLAAGRLGKIVLTLHSEKLPQMGLTQTSVYLSREPGDKISEANEVDVSVVLLPDFSKLSAQQLSQAPIMQLSTDSVSLDITKKKRRQGGVITITNQGQTDLTINRFQVFNRALDVELGNRTIAPGKKVKLRVSIDAKRLQKDKSRTKILLITNDPNHPKEIITVGVKPANK